MRHVPIRRVSALLLLATLITTLTTGAAYAQGAGAASLAGTIVDTSGAILPGAHVTVTNANTGATYEASASEHGTFTVPALQPGTYTVTVTLQGFKTAVLQGVVVNTATPASVRATLEVGSLEETIQVEAAAAILQTQSSAISTTLDVKQISGLPLLSRNAIDFITFLPGVNTPGGNRDSTINGLPQSAINITIDGVNAQDNTLKTGDGFFTLINPRLDAVQEVTVTTGTPGADAAGQGAVQIRFITRSGTNDLRGSVYHYFRHHSLNSNTWFRNRDLPPDPSTGRAPKSPLVQNQPGFRVGGPIVIPGLFDGHNKAFFFVNYEEFRQPSDTARNRTILHPRAQAGFFRYNTPGGVREIDLLGLASRNGQTSTLDPTVAKLLGDIRAAALSTGGISSLTEPIQERFSYAVPTRTLNRYPTVRLDFNLSQAHRLSAITYYQPFDTAPDTLNNRDATFPGFPNEGTQQSDRNSYSVALRSTLTPSLVNDARIGYQTHQLRFSTETGLGQFSGTPVGDQGGFNLNLNGALGLTNATSGAGLERRRAPNLNIENTLNWIKGTHTVSFGGSFTQVSLWQQFHTVVPQINFGLATADPALAMFTGANFPDASNADITRAQNLYAVLTGRVTAINGSIVLDENTNTYSYQGPRVQQARMREVGLFAQDSWRIRQNLTVNAGLRWELQFPFVTMNSVYTTADPDDVFGVSGPGNLFNPGVLEGRRTEFVRYDQGQRAYNVDYNNFAPNLGFAWTPSRAPSWLRPIVGREGDSVIRGGYAIAYNRHGMSDFTGVYSDNPGALIGTNRTVGNGNLVYPGETYPLLLRDRSRLGPPPFSATPTYPLIDIPIGEDMNVFDPNLQTPYAQSWSVGWQRSLARDMAVEIRYLGTRHLQGWTEYNFNEANIVENGFLNEFRLAQSNLQSNIAAGRGNSFAYFGPGTGTAPLPIYLAYFSGVPMGQAGDPSRYTSTLFSSTNFTNALAIFNPQPFTPAGTGATTGLEGDPARIANARAAGLPLNFFRVNPQLQGGATITGNGGYTRYDAMQLELRRRMSGGFQFSGSYVYGLGYLSSRYSFRRPRVKTLDSGAEGSVTHAFKAAWLYELPFGRDRRFGGNVGTWWDRLIGGWSIDGTARVQSGRLLDFGNVRMVGFTEAELKDFFRLRFAEDGNVFMLPQDIIDNTVKAFSVSATSRTGYGPLGPPSGRYFAPANGPDCIEVATGYGDCGARSIVVTGPRLVRVDLSVNKRVRIVGRTEVEFGAQMLNAFNHPYFTPVTYTDDAGNTAQNVGDNYRVRAADSGRIIQLVSRVTW